MVNLHLELSLLRNGRPSLKRDYESVHDDPCEGHMKSTTKPEIIEKVHDMILENRRMRGKLVK